MTTLYIAIRVDDLNPSHARLSVFQGRRGDTSLGKAGELIITADCLQAMCERLQPSVIYWSADSETPTWLANLSTPAADVTPEAQEPTETPTEGDETVDAFFARVGGQR